MKSFFLYLFCAASSFPIFAQVNNVLSPTKPKSLPRELYMMLRDSCTQLDIVFLAGNSMSLDGRNVRMFSSLVDWNTTPKINTEKKGFLMWQINGREFLTGDMYFTGDTSGYLLFKKDGQEYINKLTTQGASFLQRNK